jgi:CRP-like cAMP-binding protein
MALLDDAPRAATAVARGHTTIGVLPAEKFRALLAAHPDMELVILRNIVKVLCGHIRLANVQIDCLMHLE